MQPNLSNFADARDILHRLEHALKYAVFITHSDVVDIDKFAVKLQPKVGLVTLALAKDVDNLRHASYALARVAVFHVAPDDACASRKYAALRVGVKFHDLALIDEREIDGHMAKMRLICSSASLPVATSRTLFCAVFRSFRPYFATKFASSIRKFGSNLPRLNLKHFAR